MKKNTIVILLMTLATANAYSQTFYDSEKDFGRVDIIDDSTMRCYFIFANYVKKEDNYQEVRYYRKGDTLFLSSGIEPKLSVQEISKDEFENNKAGDLSEKEPVIVKVYGKTNERFLCYQYDYYINAESIEYADPTTRTIYYELFKGFLDTAIVVVKYDGDYIRCTYNPNQIERDNYSYLMLKVSKSRNSYPLYLRDFPVLLSRNRLIPLSEEKQFDCWVNNGFRFPNMKHSSKDRWSFKFLTSYWRTGIENLMGIYRFQCLYDK